MRFKFTPLRVAFLLGGLFFASVGISSLALGAYKDYCTKEERRPVPINTTEDMYRNIVEYRKSDVLGYSCGRDVIVTERKRTTEFDCWRNGTIGQESLDRCSCEISIVSWPKQKVWRC